MLLIGQSLPKFNCACIHTCTCSLNYYLLLNGKTYVLSISTFLMTGGFKITYSLLIKLNHENFSEGLLMVYALEKHPINHLNAAMYRFYILVEFRKCEYSRFIRYAVILK